MIASSLARLWRRSLLRSDLARRLGGALSDLDGEVTGFATDSREAKPGDGFLAIRGERVDGHDYLPIEGVVGIVERPVEGPHILVPNLVEALAEMARTFRAEFAGPVVGITGSAGKTTAKEFAAAALSPLGPVAKTPANRNTEFTGPLLWAQLPAEAKSVVVEMGMRGAGQIAHLAAFSRPMIGVVTNVGWAHLELLQTRERIALAKGELFEALPAEGTAVAWAEDEFLGTLIGAAGNRRLVTFGYGGNADLQLTRVEPLSWRGTALEGVCFGQGFTGEIPALGRHVALSAAAGLLAAVVAGAPLAAASAALKNAELPPLRMEIREWNGATIVLDAYNASPPAVVAALEAFAGVRVEGRKLAILGPMRELGDESEEAHAEVGTALGQAQKSGGVEGLLYAPEGYESDMSALSRASARAGHEPQTVRAMGDLTAALRELKDGDAALLKASRAFELEKAVPA